MKRSVLGLFAVLLLGGCSDSVRDMEMGNDKSPAANATVATETPATPAAAAGSAAAAVEAALPVDAARLLAATLERAKADNKRVMVHLGAPW
jgi:hypothetical protein